jgi:putative membrane protein
VEVTSWQALAVAAIVLGLLNALVRPILVLLTLPITVLTLGLFYLIVNGFTFLLASKLVPGFDVSGFWWAVLGALVVSLVSWFAACRIALEHDRIGLSLTRCRRELSHGHCGTNPSRCAQRIPGSGQRPCARTRRGRSWPSPTLLG